MFLSHTSELREFPRGASYVDAAERAVSAAGHVIVDMAGFPAADLPAAQLCAGRVRGCDVYVGVLGTRYGSPVRDKPEVSYTELEFEAATEAGLPRLVFLLDTGADDVRIPLSMLIDREFGARQDAFRGRVRDSGLVTGSFANPAGLGQLLQRTGTDRYPHGLAAAVLLALDAVRAGDGTGVCGAVMDLVSVLSAAGVPRAVLHAAGRAGALGEQGQGGGVAAEVVDEALGRLAGSSLLTFSTGGGTVTAHRLVMRVIRERLARQGRLAAACQAAAAALQARAGSLEQAWQDRPARRDLAEQILAVHEHAAVFSGEDGSDLIQAVLRLRGWAVWFLNDLGDSAAQAIAVGEPLLADLDRVLGPDHPDTLASRNNLAAAYRAAGRFAEAIALHERTLAGRERVLGPDHPATLNSRNNLAAAYQEAGRFAEAIALFERTLADMERILCPDHPRTMTVRGNLAAARASQG